MIKNWGWDSGKVTTYDYEMGFKERSDFENITQFH